MAEVHPAVPPRSPLGKALHYLLAQWPAVRRFLKDGGLPLDTNDVECTLRAVAIGRKYWLFAGSDAGARRAAVLYSVLGSCVRCDVEPWAYLRAVLLTLNGTTFPHSRVRELLPDVWGAAHPEALTAAAA